MNKTWSAEALAASYPLRFRNPNKQAVYEECCPFGTKFKGEILIARWAQMDLPNRPFEISSAPKAQMVKGFFDYTDETARTHWYPNFADPDLFGYWDSGLLAQDELQVLEHPILAAVRKHMLAEGMTTATTDYDTVTPFVLRGVERHIALDVRELYGNAFDAAPVEKCLDAATRLAPPTISNIYALTAIDCGHGPYTQLQIMRLMGAAYTAFRAVKTVTETNECVLHLGYWGCGAFGGNRVLMSALQFLAAHFADIDHVLFHTGGDGTPGSPERARCLEGFHVFREIASKGITPADAIFELLLKDYEWGESDGN